ncbi:MAG TPA: nuclear transport factor 2 family protein [Candidatus Eremiobacteraceae bacterium]|nr:nuclear transport factor 2 family protein [Candidatus Eremiobacteraceae bacterium]
MPRIQILKQSDLTKTLAERLRQVWDAYLMANQEMHSEVLADDYRAVHPDGTVRQGKPSAREMAAAPIEDYWLRELEAWPVGDEGAIATYTAEVEVRSGLSARRHQFAVGEVWMKHGGVWKCRYYHATMLK